MDDECLLFNLTCSIAHPLQAHTKITADAGHAPLGTPPTLHSTKMEHRPITNERTLAQPIQLTASVAVVGCAEDRDCVLIMRPVVALHH